MYRIGFDAKRLFNNFTGLGNYSRWLVQSLKNNYPENEYCLFTPKISKNFNNDFFNEDNFKIYSTTDTFKSYWRSFSIMWDIKKKGMNIYHGLSNEIPFVKNPECKFIVTIHDLMYEVFPHDFSFIDRNIYRIKTVNSCKNADLIHAISQSTKNDIIKYLGIDEKKIKVIYQSCDDIFKKQITEIELNNVKKKYKLPDNFMLCLGSANKRKNIDGILKAVKILSQNQRIPLVVAGKGNFNKTEISKYIKENGLEKDVFFIQNLSLNDLPCIYKLAEVFIYPSFYEGFGIPIIEALHCGTPVICSDTSSMPEAGGDGAIYVNPANPESISEAIIKITSDSVLRSNLAKSGIEHIKKFDTKILSGQIMNSYSDLLLS